MPVKDLDRDQLSPLSSGFSFKLGADREAHEAGSAGGRRGRQGGREVEEEAEERALLTTTVISARRPDNSR